MVANTNDWRIKGESAAPVLMRENNELRDKLSEAQARIEALDEFARNAL